MNSEATAAFWPLYRRLPEAVRAQARKQYRLWRRNPRHPSLRLKRVSTRNRVISVRINDNHRALALEEDNTVVWFWIGHHGEYDRLISRF